MRQQMKGNRMAKTRFMRDMMKGARKIPEGAIKTKKKPKLKKKAGGGKVIKANMGKLLETVSPAYSIMKGKGPISDAFSGAGGMGLGGILGMLAKGQKGKRKGMEAEQMKQMQKMYGGGAVKKRRDGIASKGKTKGTVR